MSESLFRSKNLKDMDKNELLEVIDYLVAEMNDYKKSSEKLGSFANEVFISLKPRHAKPFVDKWIEAHK